MKWGRTIISRCCMVISARVLERGDPMGAPEV